MEKITSLRLYPYTQNYTRTTQLQNSKLSNPNPNYNFHLSLYVYTDQSILSLVHSINSAILCHLYRSFPHLVFWQSEQLVSEFHICFFAKPAICFRILYLQRRTSIFQVAAPHEFCSIVILSPSII